MIDNIGCSECGRTGLGIYCSECWDHLGIDEVASANERLAASEAREAALRGALTDLTMAARSAAVFIQSREQMHPVGVALFHEALDRAIRALTDAGGGKR